MAGDVGLFTRYGYHITILTRHLNQIYTANVLQRWFLINFRCIWPRRRWFFFFRGYHLHDFGFLGRWGSRFLLDGGGIYGYGCGATSGDSPCHAQSQFLLWRL
uniref:Uncharacterized protein n=1 Tax=mine drainage metagenome TaxID=410659 RepID=E6QNN1_9ZZZZ